LNKKILRIVVSYLATLSVSRLDTCPVLPLHQHESMEPVCGTQWVANLERLKSRKENT
jgi:hypothetical protein